MLEFRFILDLSPLFRSEQAFQRDIGASHHLDPSDNLELILDHFVRLVSQLVSAVVQLSAAWAGKANSLEAELDTSPEANWDSLELLVFSFVVFKFFLVVNLFVAFIFRSVLILIDNVGVVTHVVDRSFVLEYDDQSGEQGLHSTCETTDRSEEIEDGEDLTGDFDQISIELIGDSQLTVVFEIIQSERTWSCLEEVMFLSVGSDGPNLVVQVKLSQVDVVVVIDSNLGADNIPYEAGFLANFRILNLVFVECFRVFQDNDELSVKPLLNSFLFFAVFCSNSDSISVNGVHTDFKLNDKLSSSCRVVVALDDSIIADALQHLVEPPDVRN